MEFKSPVAESKAKVIAAFEANIADLKACQISGYILAWPNGLGVRFPEEGKPVACGLWMAEEIVSPEQAEKMPEEAWAYIPNVINGAGERAQLVKAPQAIAAEIAKIEGMLQQIID